MVDIKEKDFYKHLSYFYINKYQLSNDHLESELYHNLGRHYLTKYHKIIETEFNNTITPKSNGEFFIGINTPLPIDMREKDHCPYCDTQQPLDFYYEKWLGYKETYDHWVTQYNRGIRHFLFSDQVQPVYIYPICTNGRCKKPLQLGYYEKCIGYNTESTMPIVAIFERDPIKGEPNE